MSVPDSLFHGVAAVPRLGVIRAQGEDASKFLHSQLTSDFSLLGLSQARLAGFCSAKGRLLASFIGFKRSHDDILLVCSADLLPATLKRLSMFVLRSKVKLSDASASFQIRGLVGTAVPQLLPTEPWSKLDVEGAQLVRLYPGDGQARALWIAASEAPPAVGPELDTSTWDWLEVMAGVPLLTQAVAEAFVPQMINMESVGGVNFKKGCYPGQEVVARSQFRGTLKRRGYLVRCDASIEVGQEMFHDSDLSQPCGTVFAAAASPAGGWNAMVSMQTSAAEGGLLHASAADGPVVYLLPLPYPLLSDI